jgi:RNA polymerase subunit RPABC4/transcription elongation factor Spt4
MHVRYLKTGRSGSGFGPEKEENMDFFTDLGNKITSTGKTVADKAKDLTELTRLNARVVSEEGKLSKAYCEIGKLYYAQSKGELDGPYEEYAAAASASLSEITALKEQIKNLKGVRVCVQCGREIGKNDLYCSSCGARNDFEEPETKPVDQICPVCKSVVPADVLYCPTCGEKLVRTEEEAADNDSETECAAEAEAAEAVEAEEASDDCGCGCGCTESETTVDSEEQNN